MDKVATPPGRPARPPGHVFRFEGVAGSDGRTLVGLAVPFDEPTRIDNWIEGTFDEQFRKGAFKRTIGERKPKLQFDHGTHGLFGSLPIGEIRDLKETDRGLEIEARIFEAELFAPLREAIASEALDGMSIRFRALQMEKTLPQSDDEVELRTVTEAELFELGPVVFPAYPGTEVDMRSLGIIDLANENDRHRLASALLGGVSLVGQGSTIPQEPGTGPPGGTPAVTSDPVSDPTPEHHRLRALARIRELETRR